MAHETSFAVGATESSISAGSGLRALKHRVKGPAILPAAMLVGANVVAVYLSLGLAYAMRLQLADLVPIELGEDQYRGLLIGALAIPGLGLFRSLFPGYGLTPPERLRLMTQNTIYVFIGLGLIDYLANKGAWSRGMLVLGFVTCLMLPFVIDQLARRWLAATGRWGTPIIVIGTAGRAAEVVRRLRSHRSLGLVPACIAVPDMRTRHIEGLPVIDANHLDQVPGDPSPFRVAVVCDGELVRRVGVFELRRRFDLQRIIYVPPLQDQPTLWLVVRDLGGFVGLEMPDNLASLSNRAIKRGLDIVLATMASFLCLPVILAAAAVVMLVSPGLPLFSQMRQGRDGRPFRIWKIRTMRPDAERQLEWVLKTDPQARAQWRRSVKLDDDPRIIPGIGTFLRRSSIDELPQLWNVIRGHLSLVGPRPLPGYHLERFTDEFRCMRQSIRPGLSGLWQVMARSDADIGVQESYDRYYIQNWSIWLDIFIVLKTVESVLLGRGAR